MAAERVRRRVAWNELPASLAVDIWREYAAKFTLADLFKPDKSIPPALPPVPQPTDEEIDPLSQPIQVTTNQSTLQDRFAQLLHEINLILDRIIKALDAVPRGEQNKKTVPPGIGKPATPADKNEPANGTALQVINEMVNARLKSPEVIDLDSHGGRGQGKIDSQEYQLLKQRGIVVLSVSIGNVQLKKDIEDKIIEKWSASWLKNAETEKKQIERRQSIARSAAQEQAMRQYADLLSDDLLRKKPEGISETLKTLLIRSNKIIVNNDQLHKGMSEAQETLEDILRWVEADE